jgi:hypothetical protein
MTDSNPQIEQQEADDQVATGLKPSHSESVPQNGRE